MKPWQNIHSDFRLNGKSFSFPELNDFADSLTAREDDQQKSLGSFLSEWLSSEETVSVTTSGSTGIPKSILLEKEKMIASARATGAYFRLSAKTKALHCLPIEFIAGKMMLVRAMVLGWHLDVVTPNSTPISQTENSYDFAALVPFQAHHSLEELHRVKTVIVGGGVVSDALIEQLQQIPSDIYATYGMTETITHIAVKKLKRQESEKMPFYEALPDVTFALDERNCLVISAPKISEEKVVTNDMAELISETRFLWLGRFDNVINSGGIKIHPEKLEPQLEKYIDTPFFIASQPDEMLGEKVILIVEGEKKNFPDTMFSGFSRYELPKHIYFVSHFAYTKNGKLQRKETLEKIA